MPKKKILLVGDEMKTDLWEAQLSEKFDCATCNGSAGEIVKYLKANPLEEGASLLVSENIMLSREERMDPNFPSELKGEKNMERGAPLIAYARQTGLIRSDSPAYLVTSFSEKEKYAVEPEGVTRIVRIGGGENIAPQLEPPLHKQDVRTMVRGEPK